MTLYTFPDPRADVAAVLAANAALWPTATWSTSFPTSTIAVPHIQHAWDGTPSGSRSREAATIRVTVWTPKGKVSDGINLASLVQAVLLDADSSNVWRYTRGAGRTPGVDDATELPFCTFTVTAETRPHAVA